MDANYNISGKLSEALEKAIYLTQDLQLTSITTCALALTILMDDTNIIQQNYLEGGYEPVDANSFAYSLMSIKELYEVVFNEPFPEEEIEEPAEPDKADEADETEETSENVEKERSLNVTISFVNTSAENYFTTKYSKNLKEAFDDAQTRCYNSKLQYIDEDNLLYSILNLEDCSAVRLFEQFEVDIEELKNILLYNSNIYVNNPNSKVRIPPNLATFCKVLNNDYSVGEKCEILKRDREIFKVWSIFSKKTKRNAILVGEAGVGKSAIVEAITLQIVNGKCPREFKDYSVISLDLTSMVAGTKYRGEFEMKVQNFISFIENSENIIIFVDEIHHIFGAGATENSGLDFSGSLKPILARDDVLFIGATTNLEYQRFFNVDPAFKRRFEKIEIREPKLSEVKDMIREKVKNISDYHKIAISDELIDYIIITAKAMNFEANNPDVTIDLVDRSMAIAKMRRAKELTKKDVDKVYAENYLAFKKTSKKNKLSTAYHEAGHALMHMLAKYHKREDVKIVSIIPTSDYLGATISEDSENVSPINRNAVMEIASIQIAGRIAQEFVEKDWDFGASEDLVKSTDIIRRMIVDMGMDESVYTNISLSTYGNETRTMSPEAVDKVNDRIKEIMNTVTTETRIILNNNRDKLDIIAKLLYDNGIISIEQIMSEFKKQGVKLPK